MKQFEDLKIHDYKLNSRCFIERSRDIFKKRVFLFAIFSFLLSTYTFAQQVTVQTDTTDIRIGEQFLYQLSISDTANVILPKLDNLKGLEIVEDKKLDTIKNNLIKKYILTGFDSGAYYIPSQQVYIRGRAFITDSILINVATVAVDTTKQKMFAIKSIREEPYVFDDFKPYIKWIVLGVLLIAALVYYLKTRKKEEEIIEVEEVLSPLELAMSKFKKLDEQLLWQNNKIKLFYSELTEIVRAYIETELKIPALEITSDELLNYLDDCLKAETIETNPETLKKLKELLQEADLVKFAKSKPLSHEIEEDRKDAEDIVKQLQPKPEPEVEIEEESKEENELE